MFFTRFHVLVGNLPMLKKLTLFKRTKEHVTWADSVIKGHLDNCLNVEHLLFINNLILNDVNMHKFRLNLIYCQNIRKSDQSFNWNVLLVAISKNVF